MIVDAQGIELEEGDKISYVDTSGTGRWYQQIAFINRIEDNNVFITKENSNYERKLTKPETMAVLLQKNPKTIFLANCENHEEE